MQNCYSCYCRVNNCPHNNLVNLGQSSAHHGSGSVICIWFVYWICKSMLIDRDQNTYIFTCTIFTWLNQKVHSALCLRFILNTVNIAWNTFSRRRHFGSMNIFTVHHSQHFLINKKDRALPLLITNLPPHKPIILLCLLFFVILKRAVSERKLAYKISKLKKKVLRSHTNQS